MQFKSKHDQIVNQRIIKKYDMQFNFFLAKPTNEIMYNMHETLSTIHFKDSTIFSEQNQYLKRYYFLVNSIGKDEIYDRINLLADFYSSAIVLRYEYPQMILTKTKSIFQKRLKRMKKILVQQGSSDESKSDISSKVIEFHSQQFLKSISQSQLKSLRDSQSRNFELSGFSLMNEEYQVEFHDTYAQIQTDQEKNSDNLFFAKIGRLTQQITCQLTLEKQQEENELSHIISDFEEFDKEEVIRKYKIIQQMETYHMIKKEKRHESQFISPKSKNPLKLKQLVDKRPMTSSITITPLQNQLHSTVSNKLQKKSMILNQKETFPHQSMKISSFYEYENHTPRNFQHDKGIIDQRDDQESPTDKRHWKRFPSQEIDKYLPYQNVQSPKEKQYDGLRENIQINRKKHNLKYSQILNNDEIFYSKNRQKGKKLLTSDFEPLNSKHFNYRSNEDFAKKYSHRRHEQQEANDHIPLSSNRMTSINININNLEQKKQIPNIQVKLQPRFGQEYPDHKEIDRVEKKKKIREKAAALLQRVKSQEYITNKYNVKMDQQDAYHKYF